MSIFAVGLVLSLVWNHPFIKAITTLAKYKQLITEDHLLSGGVVFAIVLIFFGKRFCLSMYFVRTCICLAAII